jgi:acyl-CoA dehydrogenase
MALVLNEEQRMLKDSAREFLASSAPVAALRELRDARDPVGYRTDLWQQMAELGWASIILPQQYGGLDFGFTGLGVVLEETGRTLTASPLYATAVVGASALMLGGREQQKETLLPELAAGRLTLALALEESHHHDPLGIATRAEKQGDGYVINGCKTFVLDGHSADKLIVVARTGAGESADTGLSLLLVDREAPGVKCQRTTLMDSRNAANVSFEDVAVDVDAIIGEADQGWTVLEPVLDRGRVAIAAEMMGLALEAFDRTVEYLKCRSVILQALSAVDETPDQLPLLASLAKARLNELVKLVTNEAVQMHGGIGVTDELEIGFFLKRARVATQIFGDTGFHKDRYATLCGY